MDTSIVSGMFALGGAVIGGFTTYMTAHVDRRWGRARRQITQLCDQVSAYYQLEALYKVRLAEADPDGRSPKTIMEAMRAHVAETGEYERPSITSAGAARIRKEWQ